MAKVQKANNLAKKGVPKGASFGPPFGYYKTPTLQRVRMNAFKAYGGKPEGASHRSQASYTGHQSNSSEKKPKLVPSQHPPHILVSQKDDPRSRSLSPVRVEPLADEDPPLVIPQRD
jgi:hypothetical protein